MMSKNIRDRARRRMGTMRNVTASLALGTVLAIGGKTAVGGEISQMPLFVGSGETLPPLVMLALSNDHQLYFKAFNDFTDLDGDDVLDTDYDDGIEYYGYFESTRCYSYNDSGDGQFDPEGRVDGYDSTTGGVSNHYCTGTQDGYWSGNFLNWATMARIDIVRKLLYGGKRSTDTSSATVLQRTLLPHDAHSWAKHYAGDDLESLTPFSDVHTTGDGAPTGASPDTLTVGTGSITVNVTPGSIDDADLQYADQIVLTSLNGNARMSGIVEAYDTSTNELTVYVTAASGSGTRTGWTISNPSRLGLTICNTTVADPNDTSQDSSEEVDTSLFPPLARVARGDYSLWNANERWQCRWGEEKSGTGQNSINGHNYSNQNVASRTGLFASAENPYEADVGLGEGDYTVRVSVCESGKLETNCKEYPDGNYKPTGLLQDYGDDELLHFGLLTGSYSRNKSGGLLRKNIEAFTDEVNTDTDGTFTGSFGIVETLDRLRLHGYDYEDGIYNNNDDCQWGWNSFNNGQCSNWGNPFSEIYLEAVRYFAVTGASRGPTPAFNGDDTSYIDGLEDVAWDDPLNNNNYCSNLSVVAFNSSSSSYDGDELDVSGLNTDGSSATDLTNVVGDGEGINGSDVFIGTVGGTGDELCTSKSGDLGELAGICPEAPRLSGTYNVAGLAHHARIADLRPNFGEYPHEDQTLSTFGVELATAVPEISIPVGTGREVTLLPACRNQSVGGNCALVDFKVINQDSSSGRFFVLWEDSEQGGDFDQDMAGILTYTVSSGSVTVETRVFGQSTGDGMGFGYVIGGTDEDGFHSHSGINGYNFTDAFGSIPGCSNCQFSDAATSHTYTAGTSDVDLLESPLYYAAKWGGFEDADEAGDAGYQIPDQTEEWDADNDGLPDKYFFAIDPSELQESLDDAFSTILEQAASSAPVASNTGIATQTDTRIYQPIFITGQWYGQLLSLPIGSDGNVQDPAWDAGEVLADLNWDSDREVLTYSVDNSQGIPFRWNSLDTAQQGDLDAHPDTGNDDGRGEDRLAYIRGDTSNERRQTGGIFRNRPVVDGTPRVLGDIVNSAPVWVGAPAFRYDRFLDAPEASSYAQHAATYSNRTEMVYVGANDGMLHGFRASDGEELLAYVPSSLIDDVGELTSDSYEHRYFVDNTPTIVDAYWGSNWHTLLVGGLGGGGQQIYALDVTNPTNFDESNASSLVLWEFDDSDDADLGYTFSRPAVIRSNDDSNPWVVVVGNGYNNTEADGNASTDGKGKVYFLDAETGSVITSIDFPDGTVASPNGVSAVAPVDIDGDFKADVVYAGDVKGNLWKIDISSANANNWGSAYTNGGNPEALFEAEDENGDPQPITVLPAVRPHPTSKGFMVYFGTGKYFETNDGAVVADAQTQTFYMVWDPMDTDYLGSGGSAQQNPPLSVNRTCTSDCDFVEQEVIDTLAAPNGDQVRVTSDNDVQWFEDVAATNSTPDIVNWGWYMDLPANGERAVTNPVVRDDRILFTTLIPLENPCDFGGTGWLMELNARTGGRLSFSPFDVDANEDGQYTDADLIGVDLDGDGTIDEYVAAGGRQSDVGIPSAPTVLAGGGPGGQECPGGECKYISGSTGQIEKVNNNTGTSQGRQSWRELR